MESAVTTGRRIEVALLGVCLALALPMAAHATAPLHHGSYHHHHGPHQASNAGKHKHHTGVASKSEHRLTTPS
jgi:hypothetical protein